MPVIQHFIVILNVSMVLDVPGCNFNVQIPTKNIIGIKRKNSNNYFETKPKIMGDAALKIEGRTKTILKNWVTYNTKVLSVTLRHNI